MCSSSLLEERAKRRLFRGAFGSGPKEGVPPWLKFKVRNPGNVSLTLYNGKLYALYEVRDFSLYERMIKFRACLRVNWTLSLWKLYIQLCLTIQSSLFLALHNE